MKFIKFLPILCCFFWSIPSNSQVISTNQNGETIIQYDDGSWRFFDKEDEYDQFLMKKHLQSLKKRGTENNHDNDPAAILAIPASVTIDKLAKLNKKINLARINLEDAQDEKQIIIDQIKRNKKAKNVLKVAMLKTLLKKQKSKIKTYKQTYKDAKKELALHQSILKFRKKQEKNADVDPKDIEIATESDEQIESSGNHKKKAEYASYSVDNDVMLNPPTIPCEFLDKDVPDDQNPTKLVPKKFFTYTPSAMMANQKDKTHNYIYCSGQISLIKGGNLILNLVITIDSESAKNEYGLIEKGSMMILKMVDKSSISIRSRKTTIGRSNEIDKSVIYEASYTIPSGSVKKLKMMELDKVKLIWSTGYEEYEIYETDFFINQLNCFQ